MNLGGERSLGTQTNQRSPKPRIGGAEIESDSPDYFKAALWVLLILFCLGFWGVVFWSAVTFGQAVPAALIPKVFEPIVAPTPASPIYLPPEPTVECRKISAGKTCATYVTEYQLSWRNGGGQPPVVIPARTYIAPFPCECGE